MKKKNLPFDTWFKKQFGQPLSVKKHRELLNKSYDLRSELTQIDALLRKDLERTEKKLAIKKAFAALLAKTPFGV
jgi:hypothetical protein